MKFAVTIGILTAAVAAAQDMPKEIKIKRQVSIEGKVSDLGGKAAKDYKREKSFEDTFKVEVKGESIVLTCTKSEFREFDSQVAMKGDLAAKSFTLTKTWEAANKKAAVPDAIAALLNNIELSKMLPKNEDQKEISDKATVEKYAVCGECAEKIVLNKMGTFAVVHKKIQNHPHEVTMSGTAKQSGKQVPNMTARCEIKCTSSAQEAYKDPLSGLNKTRDVGSANYTVTTTINISVD